MKRIEISDILEYTCPSNPLFSEDGSYIAFETAKAEGNTYKHAVWVIRNNQAVQMTFAEDTRLAGWKDEHTLLIRRNKKDHRPGTLDLWNLDVNGGEASFFRTLPLEMNGFVKAGKGFAACAGIDCKDPDAYLDDPDAAAKKAEEREMEKDYEVLDELPYWFNGRNFTDGKRNAVFYLEDDNVTRITGAKQNVSCMTACGNTIYYAAEDWKYVSEQTQQLFAYNTETKQTAVLYDKNDLSFSSPFIRNGKLYIFATDHKAYGTNQTPDLYELTDYGMKKVYVPDRTLRSSISSDVSMGNGKTLCTDGDLWVTLVTDDDHTAIRAYHEDYSYDLLYDEQGSVTCFDIYDGKLVFVHSDAAHPFEVFIREKDGSVSRITSLNDDALKDKYVAVPERIDYVSHGLNLHGWVLKPIDYEQGKKYPAVLDIHGGPRVAYGTNFFHEMQLWASHGYFVFFTNIKGSDGRGDEFADVRDQYGFIDYDNLMDFTDAVLSAYTDIDEKKVCVTGGSYGGFMTNWIIGHTDRFCCAASQRSIANWISKCLVSDIGYHFNIEQQGAADLFTGFEPLWKHSPLKYAGNCVTPTLFIHSDEDRRCPLPEGMQMMQALMIKGVETKMCLFHGENHELSRSGKPLHRMRRLKEMTEWFNNHTENK